ncbi:hypothetical protein [Antribacter gilvus]|uniref:hypothetical protein n=1 Tax=Antribacter gilvus TaxID=2304675 RepID=UPI001F0BABC8|nr:hypothetical protein [Antribacter gilvus]
MIDILALTADLAAVLPADTFDLPDPDPALPEGVAGPVSTLFSWLRGIGLVACVIGIIVAIIMIAVGHRRGQGPQDALGSLMVPIACAIGLGGAVGLIMSVAGY